MRAFGLDGEEGKFWATCDLRAWCVAADGSCSVSPGNLDAATQQQLAQAHRRGRKSASPGPAGIAAAANGGFFGGGGHHGPPGAQRNAFAAAAAVSSGHGLHLPPGGLHGALARQQQEARLQHQTPQPQGLPVAGLAGGGTFHKGLLNGTGLLNGGHRSNSTGNHQMW